MNNAEYHAHPAISKSHLDGIARSPLHYWDKYINPDRQPEPQSDALIVGSAVHAAVLEPDLFGADYVTAPEVDRRTKTGRELYEAFTADNQGKIVLTLEQHALCLRIRKAVQAHSVAAELLSDGAAERSVITTDPEHWCEIKVRPDWLRDDGLVVDLKTTNDASPGGFAKSIANFRYHVQAAWYLDTLTAAGITADRFLFVAVEKTAPYAIGVYELGLGDLAKGRDLARRDLAAIVACRASGLWPSYGSGIETIALPRWA